MPVLTPIGKWGFLWAVLTLLVCARSVGAVNSRFEGIVRLQVRGNVNDNLVIGTETRSPLPALGDTYLDYSLRMGVRVHLPFQQSIGAYFTYYKEDEQQVTFLRRVDQTLALDWTGNVTRYFAYYVIAQNRSFSFEQLSELNFDQLSIKAFTTLQFTWGLKVQTDFSHERKHFVQHLDNITGFSLVDATENRVNVQLTKWFTSHWQLRLRFLKGQIRYAPTTAAFLLSLSGLNETTGRQDNRTLWQGGIARLLANNQVLIYLGRQIEQNESNSAYYTFRGKKALLDVGYTPAENHFIAVQSSMGKYTYPHRQFDVRYQNIKEDFRLSVMVSYQWQMLEYLQLELSYQFIRNDSNDSIDYNPFTTLTYSTFNQNIARVRLTVDLSELIF